MCDEYPGDLRPRPDSQAIIADLCCVVVSSASAMKDCQDSNVIGGGLQDYDWHVQCVWILSTKHQLL